MTVVHVNQLIFTQTTYHQQLGHQIQTIDNKENIRKLKINSRLPQNPQKHSKHFTLHLTSICSTRRNRKRRSNRRKTSQNVCNTGFTPVNEVPTNCTFVMNTPTTDTASPKKRKFSSQDVPGPSSHTKNSNQMPNETPMSEFYHSLLESSYENDFNCKFRISSNSFFVQTKMANAMVFLSFFCFAAKNQLSEQEMIEKALQMSRLEFMQSKAM